MSMANQESRRTFGSIQVCRGIAGLLVVLFHLSGCVAALKYFAEPTFSYIFRSGGAAGVCFFFVLSGFIITTVHWSDVGKPNRFPSYLYKRLARIYPIYWLVFFAAFLGALIMPGAADGIPSDISSLLKSVALLPQDPKVVGGTGAPLVIVAWSLQYEMVFYTFFGLLILNRMAALAFAAGVFGSSVSGYILGWDFPLHYLDPKYFLLFSAGVFAGVATRASLWASYARIAALSGAFGLAATAVIASITDTAPVLIYGLTAGLLIFGLASIESKRHFKIWKGWLLLGDSSYVLYLIHYPLISLACKIAIASGLTGFMGAAITWVLTLNVCVVVSVLIHLIIERRILAAARALIEPTGHAGKGASLRQGPAAVSVLPSSLEVDQAAASRPAILYSEIARQ